MSDRERGHSRFHAVRAQLEAMAKERISRRLLTPEPPVERVGVDRKPPPQARAEINDDGKNVFVQHAFSARVEQARADGEDRAPWDPSERLYVHHEVEIRHQCDHVLRCDVFRRQPPREVADITDPLYLVKTLPVRLEVFGR